MEIILDNSNRGENIIGAHSFDMRLNTLHRFGQVRERKKTEFPKLCMNFGTTRLRGRPRNRWQDEVREDGRIVGGDGWQEKVHNREEWKKLLRMARNRRILHMPMERMNSFDMVNFNILKKVYIGQAHLDFRKQQLQSRVRCSVHKTVYS